MTGSGAFDLRLGLSPVPAHLYDVLGEITDRLDAHQPQLTEGPAGLELSLTVVASDLWTAVLLALAAVADTGYVVVQLEARPVDHDPTRR